MTNRITDNDKSFYSRFTIQNDNEIKQLLGVHMLIILISQNFREGGPDCHNHGNPNVFYATSYSEHANSNPNMQSLLT